MAICDSKQVVVARDVFETEINDGFLSDICRLKSEGSCLSTLCGSGECAL